MDKNRDQNNETYGPYKKNLLTKGIRVDYE
jgi:hypothetical protein